MALAIASLALAAACGEDGNGPTSPSNTVGTVTVSATPSSLPVQGGEVDITATVRSASAAPMVNQQVTFTTSKGTLSPTAPVPTDGNGQAKVRLSTTETATVRATVAGTNVGSADLTVSVKGAVEISTTVEPAEPTATEVAKITVVARRAGSNVTGKLSIEPGNGDTIEAGDIDGTKTVEYTYKSSGGFNLRVTVEESDGSRTRDTIRLTVKDAPRGGRGGGGGSGADDIDARAVRWFADCNVSDWPVEERVLSVDIAPREICVDYSGRGSKGTFDIGIPVDATVWVFAEFNGVWYGATWDHLRPGTYCKAENANSLGAEQIMRAPMDASWVPRSGDRVGFMVSGGLVRHGCDPQTVWRTNIALITWP